MWSTAHTKLNPKIESNENNSITFPSLKYFVGYSLIFLFSTFWTVLQNYFSHFIDKQWTDCSSTTHHSVSFHECKQSCQNNKKSSLHISIQLNGPIFFRHLVKLNRANDICKCETCSVIFQSENTCSLCILLSKCSCKFTSTL